MSAVTHISAANEVKTWPLTQPCQLIVPVQGRLVPTPDSPFTTTLRTLRSSSNVRNCSNSLTRSYRLGVCIIPGYGSHTNGRNRWITVGGPSIAVQPPSTINAAGDVTCRVRGEKGDRRRHFARFAPAVKYRMGGELTAAPNAASASAEALPILHQRSLAGQVEQIAVMLKPRGNTDFL